MIVPVVMTTIFSDLGPFLILNLPQAPKKLLTKSPTRSSLRLRMMRLFTKKLTSKTDIGWGQQIRNYVLDQSRIKDLRTSVEIGNTQGVLDGDLDPFISESLKQGV